MLRSTALVSVAALSLALSAPAYAVGMNNGPPAGAILDLNGTPVPHSLTSYSVDFSASLLSTSISFALREDPAFLILTNVSVVDLTAGSGNLLTNGNFSAGVYFDPVTGNTRVPVGWTYQNTFAATFSGEVRTNSSDCLGASSCWYDGSVQAYDAISQSVDTIVGHDYRISFQLGDTGNLSIFSRLSTNGDTSTVRGNGVDLLVYAQADAVQPGVPEASTWAMMFLGFAGLGFMGYRRSRKCNGAPLTAA
jgi:hypothetical protein